MCRLRGGATTSQQGVADWLKNAEPDSLYLSVITLGELWKGVCRLPSGERRSALERWVMIDLPDQFSNRVLPVDAETALRWGEIQAAGYERGQPLPVVDSLLTATAAAARLVIVTRNARDFQRCGARVENPRS